MRSQVNPRALATRICRYTCIECMQAHRPCYAASDERERAYHPHLATTTPLQQMLAYAIATRTGVQCCMQDTTENCTISSKTNCFARLCNRAYARVLSVWSRWVRLWSTNVYDLHCPLLALQPTACVSVHAMMGKLRIDAMQIDEGLNESARARTCCQQLLSGNMLHALGFVPLMRR